MTDQRPDRRLGGILRAVSGALITLTLALASVVAVPAAVAGAAPSTMTQANTPVTSPTVSMPSIIPKPNSGAEPKVATDRGGWVQWAVMGGMVVALGIILLLVRRESHRKRALETTSETTDEPTDEPTGSGGHSPPNPGAVSTSTG